MKPIKARYLIIGVTMILTLLVAFAVMDGRPQTAENSASFNLQPPKFASAASFGDTPLGMYLDSEAGISAYYDSGEPINLSNARNAFRTIETETAEYIIGSVAVPGYDEGFDPHVYVNTEGWIMAYYLRPDAIAKIVDVRNQTISSTLLKTVVGIVASHAGVPFMDVTYYDFRYPNATRMILVAEEGWVGDTYFTIQVPGSYGYYERGWAVYGGYGGGGLSLDGVGNPGMIYNTYNHKYGSLTASQLLPDVEHSVVVQNTSSYGVLILVYRDQ
jgi:hypothetical protein